MPFNAAPYNAVTNNVTFDVEPIEGYPVYMDEMGSMKAVEAGKAKVTVTATTYTYDDNGRTVANTVTDPYIVTVHGDAEYVSANVTAVWNDAR